MGVPALWSWHQPPRVAPGSPSKPPRRGATRRPMRIQVPTIGGVRLGWAEVRGSQTRPSLTGTRGVCPSGEAPPLRLRRCPPSRDSLGPHVTVAYAPATGFRPVPSPVGPCLAVPHVVAPPASASSSPTPGPHSTSPHLSERLTRPMRGLPSPAGAWLSSASSTLAVPPGASR
jgi:hypothetical protein